MNSLVASGAALLALVAQETGEQRTPALVTEADVIALVRVVESQYVPLRDPEAAKRRGVSAGVTLTEVCVEQAFLGAPVGEPLFVLAEGAGSSLAPDTRCILFLLRAPGFEQRTDAGGKRAHRKLRAATAGRPHQLAMGEGTWRLTPDGARVLVPRELPLPAALRGGEAGVPVARLATWLDAAIERTTPRLVAAHSTTGPSAWRVVIEPDGSWSSAAGEQGVLDPEAWAALLHKLDSDVFYELPPRIGAPRGPDEGFHVLTLRSRRGVKRIRVHASPGDPEAAAAMRREMDLALSIWNALPGSDKP